MLDVTPAGRPDRSLRDGADVSDVPDGSASPSAGGEAVGYVAAVVVLVVGGMLARTFLLNWIVGPGVVAPAGRLGHRPGSAPVGARPATGHRGHRPGGPRRPV